MRPAGPRRGYEAHERRYRTRPQLRPRRGLVRGDAARRPRAASLSPCARSAVRQVIVAILGEDARNELEAAPCRWLDDVLTELADPPSPARPPATREETKGARRRPSSTALACFARAS